jgi:hypothetical protein
VLILGMVQEGLERKLQGRIAHPGSDTLLTSEQEATEKIITVHEDDPVYFELLLKFLYIQRWDQAIANKKGSESSPQPPLRSIFSNPIGVYALADKYDVPALMECAVSQFPIHEVCGNKIGMVKATEAILMVRAHYDQCIVANSALGRIICEYVIRTGLIKATQFPGLANKYPHLLIDLFWVARDTGGKLW